MKSLKPLALSLLCLCIIVLGCHTTNKTRKGAAIGAGTGGIVGAFIGKSAGNTALGAIIGGAVGGTAGAFIGKNMDKRAAEITQTVPGATVIRNGEGIIVKFDSGLLFDAGQSSLNPAAQNNLQGLGASLQKDSATNILIIGHTDSKETTGSSITQLSIQRAQSVKQYLADGGVDTTRMIIFGKGENEPIADNNTPDGRAQNRRVEIVIVASEAMKKLAEKVDN